MKYKIKLDPKILYLLITEMILILLVIFGAILYTKSEKRVNELEKQLMAKSETQGIKDVRSELASYKASTQKKETNSSKAISFVEEFLKTYYESDSISTYTKLILCEKYLSDSALRKLCPNDDGQEEISDELFQRIRNHDVDLINSDTSNIKNQVANLDVYYRGDSSRKERVLAYFTLETYKKNGEHKTSSTYIFEGTVGEVEGNLLITDILLKSPVIFPAYNPEVSITN